MNQMPRKNIEIIENDAFSYDGYQVVHGEFFSHTCEPSFTFNNYRVYVNAACIRNTPDFDYVQILVNPDEKKLAVKPCREEEKDSLRWCSATAKRSPKQIICKIFFAKVMALMGWNYDYRYRLIGKLLKSKDDMLFVFDLTTPEVFEKKPATEMKVKTLCAPSYPSEWKNQFGLPAEQHNSAIQMNIFDGYMVFSIGNKEAKEAINNE